MKKHTWEMTKEEFDEWIVETQIDIDTFLIRHYKDKLTKYEEFWAEQHSIMISLEVDPTDILDKYIDAIKTIQQYGIYYIIPKKMRFDIAIYTQRRINW